MGLAIAITAVLVAGTALILWDRAAKHKSARLVKEFTDAYPDKCLACDFYEYSVRNGVAIRVKPAPDHACKYKTPRKKDVECPCDCSDASMGSCGDCGEGPITLHCRKCCTHPGLWHSLYG